MMRDTTKYTLFLLAAVVAIFLAGCAVAASPIQGLPGLSADLVTPENFTAEPRLPDFKDEEVAAAKAVVLAYFKAVEAQDKDALLNTLTSWHNTPNAVYFEGETRKLLTITYDSQDFFRRAYITNGRGSGNGATIENVIVFKVSFSVTYPYKGFVSSFSDGVYNDWSMILIRQDASKPWLIDDQGY
jgi:hypothetical protein